MPKVERTSKGTFQRTLLKTEQIVIELYQQGKTRKIIEEKTGIGTGGVRNILHRNNIPLRGMPATRKYPTEKYNEAIILYQKGENQAEIAKKIDIPFKIIKNWIKRSGITKRPPRRTPQHIKDEIIRLYVDEQMTAREIGARLGMTESAIGTHLNKSGKRRTISEAQTLSANKRPFKKGRGGYWQSTKTGKWVYAMSVMEMLRMQQLDTDPTVKAWDRFVPAVDWKEGKYVPDLFVEYTDGRKIVEEVKPSSQHKYDENQQKWQAAIEHFGKQGIGFAVVDENDVGGELAIRSFRQEGLQRISEEDLKNHKRQVHKAYRERNEERIREGCSRRYQSAKADPAKYAAILEAAKLRKREIRESARLSRNSCLQ